MPPRRDQPQVEAPPRRRSERIRLRELARAASEAPRGLGIARSSHTINRPRVRPRGPVQPDRPATDGLHRTSGQGNERGPAERILRELKKFRQDPPDGCHVELKGDNLLNWTATIKGPPGTPYEDGVFRLEIVFCGNYPFSPPTVVFHTKIFHCNVSPSGYICLDILGTEWSPALGVATVLLSIMSLLSDPNPDDPLDYAVGYLFKENRQSYETMARDWTKRYAKPDQEGQ